VFPKRYKLNYYVRFEVFTAVTMKNAVFWDVTPCDSCKNRCFGGTPVLIRTYVSEERSSYIIRVT
jgi:hypothetical protein